MKYNKRRQGNEYEEAAAEYLSRQGMHIEDRNFYCKMGELDIIAKDGSYLVFVEVKYRTDGKKGAAAEAVNFFKIRKICRSADYYMMTHGYMSDTPVRFDVIAIEEGHLKHIKNAFEYII